MLVNFPFIQETEKTLEKWKENINFDSLSEEERSQFNLCRKQFIPTNLTKEDTGLDDNTGIYQSNFSIHADSVSLVENFEIVSYFDFSPVLLTEIREDRDSEEYDVYCMQKDRLWDSYGFVLSVDDFMELIGNQLKASKRKFAITFTTREVHESTFHKNGRLYAKNHEKVNLNDGDTILSFNIFELIDNQKDFCLDSNLHWNYLRHLNKQDSIENVVHEIENFRNKEHMENINI